MHSMPCDIPTRRLGNIYGVLADTLRQSGDLEGALKTVNQTVKLQEQQAAEGHPAMLINLGDALISKGMILGRADAEPSLGRSDEAAQFEAQRTELWNHWTSKLPNAQSLLRQSLQQVTAPRRPRNSPR